VSERWRFGITGTGAMQDEKKKHREWSIEHGVKSIANLGRHRAWAAGRRGDWGTRRRGEDNG
jgi:hypothetical protein